MKKIVTISVSVIIVIVGIIFNPFQTKSNDGVTTIKVAEVTHSIFYAPWYVAIEEGYFEDEGIEIDLILTPGADKVAAAVLSGDVDIGLCGPEATVYIYNGKETDYLMTFAGLTKRDGTFIVSREPIDNFTMDQLLGKTIIGGRKGGMPLMTLEMGLKEHDIDPSTDVTIDSSIEFSAMQGAFIGGLGDFVTLFEPNATDMENQGLGYVVASVGEFGGEVPYTAFNAKKSFIENNQENIEKFNHAINRGLQFVNTNTPEEVATVIVGQFPDTSIEQLTNAIMRYQNFDVWKEDTTITKEEFYRLQDIMVASGQLDSKVDYDDLIETRFFDHE
jgi:NitT/TauT family transport system substrate-binding protein